MRFFLIVGALGASIVGCADDDSSGYGGDPSGDGSMDDDYGNDVEDPEPIGGEGPDLGSDRPFQPRARHVYVMTNSNQGNEIVSLRHTSEGLVREDAFSTGGRGIGTTELPDLMPMDGIDPLVSEGAIHRRGAYLLAVNAGSRTVASLRARADGHLELVDVQAVPGHPVSITSRGDMIFVANSPGMEGNAGITTLRIDRQGELEPVGQLLELSDPSAHPSRVLIAGGGRFLVATEVMNDIINVWPLDQRGRPGERVENVSAGIGPFGAAAFGEDYLLVTEAAPMMEGKASISTYQIEADGTLTVLSDTLGNGQSATCWVQITPDEEYAYTTNTASGTISIYALSEDGMATLVEGDAQMPGMGPTDASLSPSGSHLYVLLGGGGSVAVYGVEEDGMLEEIDISSDLSLPLRGAQGILAWEPKLRGRVGMSVPDERPDRVGFNDGVEVVP